VLIEDGTLYYRKSGRTQKVVTTKKERDDILENAHRGDGSGNHANSEDMLAKIDPCYKWANVTLDIQDWVCEITTKVKQLLVLLQ